MKQRSCSGSKVVALAGGHVEGGLAKWGGAACYTGSGAGLASLRILLRVTAYSEKHRCSRRSERWIHNCLLVRRWLIWSFGACSIPPDDRQMTSRRERRRSSATDKPCWLHIRKHQSLPLLQPPSTSPCSLPPDGSALMQCAFSSSLLPRDARCSTASA
jgi:hypothetical protein